MRIVPIIFSGVCRSLLTSAALAFPSCSSACMRAREAAVSDVSAPLKKADRAISTMIARMMSALTSVMELGLYLDNGCGCTCREAPATCTL